MDNGSPFGSKGPRGWTRLSAWWIKQGLAVEFIRPGHPEDNGGHEQFHRVLKAETAAPPAQTWRGQQRRTQRWVRQYNEQRPHEALGMKVSAQRYRPSRRVWTERRTPLRYHEAGCVRRCIGPNASAPKCNQRCESKVSPKV